MLAAEVSGTYIYMATIAFAKGRAKMQCSCPYAGDFYGGCKHLWAVILAAEKAGYLAEIAQSKPENSLKKVQKVLKGKTLKPAPSEVPSWKTQLAAINSWHTDGHGFGRGWSRQRQICYSIDVGQKFSEKGLLLTLETREQKNNGEYSIVESLAMSYGDIAKLPSPEDRKILTSLFGAREYFSYVGREQLQSSLLISPLLVRSVLPQIIATGRCLLKQDGKIIASEELHWDPEPAPWDFLVKMERDEAEGWNLVAELRRGVERMSLRSPLLVNGGGVVITRDRIALLAETVDYGWLRYFLQGRSIHIPEGEQGQFLAEAFGSSVSPPLDVPRELLVEKLVVKPQPVLQLMDAAGARTNGQLPAQLSFQYEAYVVGEGAREGEHYDPISCRLVCRDAAAEKAAVELLHELGLQFALRENGLGMAWFLSVAQIPVVVRTLLRQGWHVAAENKPFRSSGEFRVGVSSGVDWFELHGQVQYDDIKAELPELLDAVRHKRPYVQLGDGSYGILPEAWLQRISAVAGMGEAVDGHIRFRRSQAGLLDALLAAQEQITCDEVFQKIREELGSFTGIEAADQPVGFVGQLREYQRDGLAWMHFLRRFSFGGCLADDMGVGKTAQVLALLETRRELREKGEISAPSLVVVPKSLIFNWKEEAARFVPKLRVLDHTGVGRSGSKIDEYDVILTTYGTLRKDALLLKDVSFDYIILDEAQAIKNAKTESAKTVRLLRGANRLALSGTPIENHLGELWSLFEFLNPGMLGSSSLFTLTEDMMRKPGDDLRKMLARALRPFVLRRTKEQVVRELPEKSEQTIYCEMPASQKRLYDELRKHYQASVMKRVKRDGLAKSKMLVLEALLRLRQAACHPGLLDPAKASAPNAKIEVLLEQLSEILEEGHKALVFSQFTSLLSIVQTYLSARAIRYEYLDGKTQNRQQRVERFQNDPNCKLFLISLKAGGLGLNLTAADYVFILDPWWNPAIEAQAVDRAHRIGQTNKVCAYRLIAKDTVEEKVLELQSTKRDLAAAIIGEDNSLISDLRSEDLELLLS